MCGEFGEVAVIIGLVINFLAFVSPFVSFRDTLSYTYFVWPFWTLRSPRQQHFRPSIQEYHQNQVQITAYLKEQLSGPDFLFFLALSPLLNPIPIQQVRAMFCQVC